MGFQRLKNVLLPLNTNLTITECKSADILKDRNNSPVMVFECTDFQKNFQPYGVMVSQEDTRKALLIENITLASNRILKEAGLNYPLLSCKVFPMKKLVD
jgi:hypothetical protein